MKKLTFLCALLASPLLLSGCGSLTGFSNAQTDFSCADLTGKPSCRNISDVYASAKEESEQSSADNAVVSTVAQGSKPEFIQPYFQYNREATSQKADSEPSPEEALLLEEHKATSAESKVSNPNFAVISPASPWRSPETIFRVWMAPFTDTEGDLHDQRYMYVKVLNAGWSVPVIDELAKPRSPYRPVYPLSQEKPQPAPKKPNPLDILQGKTS